MGQKVVSYMGEFRSKTILIYLKMGLSIPKKLLKICSTLKLLTLPSEPNQ